IEASESLDFHPCFGGFECAKLKLPLDYFNGTHPNSTISLALAKLPAKVPVDDPRYGGPILINPGGPGGSGTGFALLGARMLQTIVDAPQNPALLPDYAAKNSSSARYFDIIGFDPRGIGFTEPHAYCMEDGPSTWSWRLRETSEGILGSSDAALGRLWSMHHAYGASCKQAMSTADGPDIKRYVTTASVARDMLEITEKHAEYVTNKVNQLPVIKKAHCSGPKVDVATYTPGESKLQYWGFSYGTFLGSTFASMFPDRVGRLILDGVVSSDDYTASLGNGSLHDAEKVMHSFYTFCTLSGPDSCSLATPTSSAKDIEQRVQTIVKSLYHNPIPIDSPRGPEIFTYSDIKSLLFSSLYQPIAFFRLVSQVLIEIEAGGGKTLEALLIANRPLHVYHCPLNGTDPGTYSWYDPQHAILCSDGEDQTSLDIKAFEDYWHLLEGISPTSGAIWSDLRMSCASWKIKAVYKYSGNFGGNTSHPILWISNTADPVTPLQSGRHMQNKFPGSAILVQDSAGHCSISTPTLCTYEAIRKYFQTGALPDPDTLCIPPTTPFSLNSTDPSSPFFDPSLGKTSSAVHLDDSQMNLECESVKSTMEAGKGLQSWAARNNFFGSLHRNPSVEGLVKVLDL
ncbi:hypothetical protein BS50DRAFT_487989, partial [Corynespora cassiicola Philippines]